MTPFGVMSDNHAGETPVRIRVTEVSTPGGETATREIYVRPLSETSINRMLSHGEDGMAIISANRSGIDSENPALSLRDRYEADLGGRETTPDLEREWLRRRNAAADAALRRDIRDAGYSWSQVYGGYHGGDGMDDSYEPSFVVYNRDMRGDLRDFSDLESFARRMCGKYGQDSVYLQRPGEPPVYIDKDGNQRNVSSTKDVKINRDDEMFYTTTKRDKDRPKRFTSDIIFEDCHTRLRPASYNERLRRTRQGEFIL